MEREEILRLRKLEQEMEQQVQDGFELTEEQQYKLEKIRAKRQMLIMKSRMNKSTPTLTHFIVMLCLSRPCFPRFPLRSQEFQHSVLTSPCPSHLGPCDPEEVQRGGAHAQGHRGTPRGARSRWQARHRTHARTLPLPLPLSVPYFSHSLILTIQFPIPLSSYFTSQHCDSTQ